MILNIFILILYIYTKILFYYLSWGARLSVDWRFGHRIVGLGISLPGYFTFVILGQIDELIISSGSNDKSICQIILISSTFHQNLHKAAEAFQNISANTEQILLQALLGCYDVFASLFERFLFFCTKSIILVECPPPPWKVHQFYWYLYLTLPQANIQPWTICNPRTLFNPCFLTGLKGAYKIGIIISIHWLKDDNWLTHKPVL